MRTRNFIPAIPVVALIGIFASSGAGAQTYPSQSPSPATSATPAPGSVAQPQKSTNSAVRSRRTLIHPGDQISVQVFGDQTLTQSVMVLSDGTVDYPLI